MSNPRLETALRKEHPENDPRFRQLLRLIAKLPASRPTHSRIPDPLLWLPDPPTARGRT